MGCKIIWLSHDCGHMIYGYLKSFSPYFSLCIWSTTWFYIEIGWYLVFWNDYNQYIYFEIYLWRKVVWLFCFVCTYGIHQTRMLQIMFFISLESSGWGGLQGLGSMTFGLAVQRFLKIEWFLHWKLNKIVAENFIGIGMCLFCSWKDLDEEDLMEFIG